LRVRQGTSTSVGLRPIMKPAYPDSDANMGLGAVLMQVVDAITGNFLDSATYTKPYGWETNMTRQNATIANYVNGSYVAVPYEDAGAPDYGAVST